MRVSNVSNLYLNQNTTNFTGNPAPINKPIAEITQKALPSIKDLAVALKVKLTQVNNSDYVKLLGRLFGC